MDTCPPCSLRLRGGTGKAKPKKHTAAELAAKAKAANESVGGGKAGIAERDKNAKLTTECLEPGCAGTKLTSLTVCSASFIYLFRPVFRDFFLALFLHVLTSRVRVQRPIGPTSTARAGARPTRRRATASASRSISTSRSSKSATRSSRPTTTRPQPNPPIRTPRRPSVTRSRRSRRRRRSSTRRGNRVNSSPRRTMGRSRRERRAAGVWLLRCCFVSRFATEDRVRAAVRPEGGRSQVSN